MRRAQIFVALVGVVCLAVAALSLDRVGGPESSRRERRDALRIEALHDIMVALQCHAKAAGGPVTALAEIDPACLSADRAGELVDPASRAPYRIGATEGGAVQVCGDFEAPGKPPYADRPDAPFDRATGCVTAALAPRVAP